MIVDPAELPWIHSELAGHLDMCLRETVSLFRFDDEQELLASAGENVSLTKGAPATAQVLDAGDVAALFGLEMAELADPTASRAAAAETAKESTLKKGKRPAHAKAGVAEASGNPSRAKRVKPGTKPAVAPAVRNERARPTRSA
jgi:hypothetical protein